MIAAPMTSDMPAPLPKNEPKRLEALRRFQILESPVEQVFDDFAFLAATICQTPIALMSLLDTDRQWFKARVGLDVTETPREHAFCAHTILGNEVMVVEDATCDERFADNPLVIGDPRIRFYAGAPLIDAEGNGLGSICVIDRQPRPLSAEQRRALEALARQIISQLEFRRVSADLAEAVAEIRTLRGLLPMCSHCKGIKNVTGFWQSVETYVRDHSEADLTHTVCPTCLEKEHPALYERLHAAGKI